mmetsp:Transcript_9880/g.25549  ORF Transcript_9880/g.25549 Transcript_9880/m.25549 type:complete len:357 (-) Transcript_9880:69-1139(-)
MTGRTRAGVGLARCLGVDICCRRGLIKERALLDPFESGGFKELVDNRGREEVRHRTVVPRVPPLAEARPFLCELALLGVELSVITEERDSSRSQSGMHIAHGRTQAVWRERGEDEDEQRHVDRCRRQLRWECAISVLAVGRATRRHIPHKRSTALIVERWMLLEQADGGGGDVARGDIDRRELREQRENRRARPAPDFEHAHLPFTVGERRELRKLITQVASVLVSAQIELVEGVPVRGARAADRRDSLIGCRVLCANQSGNFLLKLLVPWHRIPRIVLHHIVRVSKPPLAPLNARIRGSDLACVPKSLLPSLCFALSPLLALLLPERLWVQLLESATPARSICTGSAITPSRAGT